MGNIAAYGDTRSFVLQPTTHNLLHKIQRYKNAHSCKRFNGNNMRAIKNLQKSHVGYISHLNSAR